MLWRRLSSLFLVLMLIAGAVQMPAPRGQGVAEGIMLCSGGAMVLVYLDAEGRPVPAPRICPDCTAAQAVALLGAQPLRMLAAPQQGRGLDALPAARGSVQRVGALPCPPARGPPVRA